MNITIIENSAGAGVLEKGGHRQFGGAHGERVEREPITGVWGQRPQRGPRAEPLVRGAKPPEAENLSDFLCPKGGRKFALF